MRIRSAKLSLLSAIAALVVAVLNLYYGNRHVSGRGRAVDHYSSHPTHGAALREEWRIPNDDGALTVHSGMALQVADGIKSHAKDLTGDDPDKLPRRIPTHHACDGYDGIYHIAMGDVEGGVGTALFQLIIGQVIYASQHNLKPWVYFDDLSYVVYDEAVHGRGDGVRFRALSGRNATYVHRPGGHRRDSVPGPPDATKLLHSKEFHFAGTGIWEHYFEPVSDFVPGDRSCESKLYTTMDLYLVTPGIHGYADWATRCWRYNYLPEYITKPHLPLAEWFEPQRRLGHETVQKYIRFRPYLLQAAARANPDCSRANSCLGLHIRHSDKAAGRKVIQVQDFLPYAQAFINAGGRHIYLATDSKQALQDVQTQWPPDISSRVRTVGDHVIRSDDTKAVFDLASHHRTNQEVLVEILALSQCQFMVHGLSAVSESSIWINLDLHIQSVNLEDPDHLTANTFETMVQMALRGESQDRLPLPIRTNEWWTAPLPDAMTPPSKLSPLNACEGYDGVLHISAVGNQASAGTAFFTSVLNQLMYADTYNLKPWVHLTNKTGEIIFDPIAHGNRTAITLNMPPGYVTRVKTSIGDALYPGKPVPSEEGRSTGKVHHYAGNGVWNSYFEPVSNFAPDDESCHDKLLVSMSDHMVTFGLQLHSPSSVKAWRYDNLPEAAWKPKDVTLNAWYQPMRRRAHKIVQKYYRFQPHIVQRADKVNSLAPGEHCLAVHLRISDKSGRYRKKVKADKFEPYVDAFERAGGRVVYIATDSHRALKYIEKDFPDSLKELIRTQGRFVVRSFKEYPTHFLEDHHRVNSETLVDILAMSKCDLLLHGFSTVSEAAIYLNPTLHNNSVNLEDPDRMSLGDFEFRARQVLGTTNGTSAPRSGTTDPTVNGQHENSRVPCVERSNATLSVQCLDSATILMRGASNRKCRSNAIVYLAQKQHSSYGRDSYGILLQSFDLLHKNYLSVDEHIDNTDVFIFHTGDFNATDLDVLEARFGSTYRGVIRLVDLSGSPYWARPKHHLEDDPKTWYAYPLFSEGYRQMMHWFAIDIWEFFDRLNAQTGCSYRYLFRMDEDSFLHSRIDYDVFDLMGTQGYVYGFRMCSYEMKVAQRMWTWWGKRHADFVPQRELDLRMCGIYNNFFVADLQFFQSPEVKAFLRYIDKQGQIYRRRLGDLMIHSMVVYGYAPQDRVHRFLDFTYEHGTVNQTNGCLIWGGIQAGYNDPDAIATLRQYEEAMTAKTCPVNTTYLTDGDLSPSYAHVPAEHRGQFSLYTVTAGRVELAGKGILSG